MSSVSHAPTAVRLEVTGLQKECSRVAHRIALWLYRSLSVQKYICVRQQTHAHLEIQTNREPLTRPRNTPPSILCRIQTPQSRFQ